MNGGRITNFTLEGDAIKLTAFLNESEKTRYALDLSFIEGEMCYEHLVETLIDLKHDIDDVLNMRNQYKENDDGSLMKDEKGRLIPMGMKPENDIIQAFEEMWNHADE